ncbi:phosphoglycerate dehydrogenase-like oxidoreductase [Caldisphaera lagunensis DSM 15908]|uniref:Phosphoglycerate dehydrogenase-like oxidoreductase n=1 Tax=Caldisphaera lagunensis (strain DSM 15908 / JCM 11604 / ANMR 0165 / IC-154) TaxID=1056495 RepID=L0AA10_CALLD|nr:phosphoglycerate dehydrogenase-like oxidoreductase [Caldisphaera lagunensis DSM 15908]
MVLIVDALVVDNVPDRLVFLLRQGGINVDYVPGLQRDNLINVLKNYEILVFRSRLKIDKEIIDSSNKLKYLARFGVGLDNVDIDYAMKKGIKIINAPNSPSKSVAQLIISMILILERHLYTIIESVKKGEWPKGKILGNEVEGKTLGIIGFGRIGRETAKIAHSLGMKILANDIIDVSNDVKKFEGMQVSLDYLLRNSDIISISVPLTPLTYHMINKDTISLIKNNSILINTARGEVIDTKALLENINKFKGIGLDVLEQEPPKDNLFKELISHENVIVTSHIGSETYEAMDRLSEELAKNIIEEVKKK